ncbi:SelB C-terminal domain-containing protein [Ornithinimicrobium sp. F0845]|uniref:selenocysteine-specific translation elongation factor n=1 Tax=Ornithinimicrobium sp. F0845 TaxID=2926412 RepID=UPI001FF43F0F|nr:SelB C-terminal domain-containing protein [Ornithinimicrobium sp. F0845]
MKRVLATAGHVDHGKSTLVRALTGQDPDRLAQEKARGLTIELGFAWTTLPSGADVAFVDVPGHQRFLGTTFAGLGPTAAVMFVVAADQGWQAQSAEHLAAIHALGIRDGVLVLTRCDLVDDEQLATTRDEAVRHLDQAGLTLPVCQVSAMTGEGLDGLRAALDDLVARMPAPDSDAPVRLWCDRSFTIAGAGTVVTGTLGAGTLRTGDRLTLLSAQHQREVVVRGLHSEDVAHDSVGPVSRVAVNLRRADPGEVGRASVLMAPGAFAVAQVIDVRLDPVEAWPGKGRQSEPGHDGPKRPGRVAAHLPARAVLHVGTAAQPIHVRPLADTDGTAGHARLTTDEPLPWHVGDVAVLRDPGDRRLWSVHVLDVDPLPLRRRGAARHRGEELNAPRSPADLRLRSRSAEHPTVLTRLGLHGPSAGERVGSWWVDTSALALWQKRLARHVRDHHAQNPLSQGVPVSEAGQALDLPDHLRPGADGGSLPHDLPPLAPDLVRHLARTAGLTITDGRVRTPEAGGLGAAESAVVAVESRLRDNPFAAPERDELTALGLGPRELAAAARQGRLLRLPDDIVLLPDGPARAMRELAALNQPFTLSAARRALGTTRRVAVPLLEHLDARGWTRRLDGQLREVVR